MRLTRSSLRIPRGDACARRARPCRLGLAPRAAARRCRADADGRARRARWPAVPAAESGAAAAGFAGRRRRRPPRSRRSPTADPPTPVEAAGRRPTRSSRATRC